VPRTPPPPPPKIADAQFLASATALPQLPPPAFAEVAFAGRSNVGKSSLINALLERRKLVRTSGTPGCTRGVNLFRVRLKDPDGVVDVVDLPGYGYAKRSHAERRSWGPLIEGFLESRPGLRGVVVIVDARRGFEAEEHELLEFLDHVGRPAILVATKTDKVPPSKRKLRLLELERDIGRRVFGFSATTGDGRDRLWRRLLRVLDVVGDDAAGDDAAGDDQRSSLASTVR